MIAGRYHRVHRLAYEVWVGPIPVGFQVNHHCDNSLCINPAHLYVGTQPENVGDMNRRGRLHPRPKKLTFAQVKEVRAKRAAGVTLRSLGEEYGITASTVRRTLLRDYDGTAHEWRQLNANPAGVKNAKAKLTDDLVRDIRVRVAAGETQAAIAAALGVRDSTISKVVRRRTWRHVTRRHDGGTLACTEPEETTA